MQISSGHQTIKNHHNAYCVIIKYPMSDQKINFAIAKITGRYPEQGFAINHICKEMVYIQHGSGKVIVNEKEYFIQTGDLILIEPKEEFAWEGNMDLLISCTPSFTQEQHEIVN